MSPSLQTNPITIVGGGLAGLGLGIGLAREGVAVNLHEAGTLPRHRVCGEFLCGRGRAALNSLGAGATLDGAAEHPAVQWYRSGRLILDSPLPSPAWGLSRFAMDQRMADQFISLGGKLHLRSRLSGGALTQGAAGHVWCTGRSPSQSEWIGLKAHACQLTTTAPLEIHLGQQAYVGLSAVENGRTNVCALFRKRPEVKAPRDGILVAYLRACGLEAVAERFLSGAPDPESFCGVAGIAFRPERASSTDARLGDRFQLIPPFTGNGMSIALESAVLALEPMLDYAKGCLSWEKASAAVQSRNQAAFGWRLRAANALHPLILNPFAQSLLGTLAKTHLLPFKTLYRATH